MASTTLETAIRLNDMVSGPLRSMHSAMNTVIDSFETMQRTSGRAVDVSSLQTARAQLARCDAAFDEIQSSIAAADRQQRTFNSDIDRGAQSSDKLLNKLKGAVSAYVGMQGASKLMDLSDTATSTQARLNLIVDDNGSLSDLENRIKASAQRSRAAYFDTASAVYKLASNAGDAFDHNNEQVIAFTELVNKQFVIAGTTAQEQSAAMLQLTQAMASGKLRGDELNSIFEQAPGLIQNIADYMDVPIGEIRELASEGEITADTVRNAMFAAADDINEQFESMPMTWSQVFTEAGNIALQLCQPALDAVNWLANNIQTALPYILTFGGAFLLLASYQSVAALATNIFTGAQMALNAAMNANPIILIISLIMVFIGILFAVVQGINSVQGTSISAIGLITGALAVAGTFVQNLLITGYNLVVTVVVSIQNIVASLANFLASVFVDPLNAIIRLFADMGDSVLGIIQGIASAIDAVFGSNLASAVNGWRSSLDSAVSSVAGERAAEVMEKYNVSDYTLDHVSYSDRWSAGYNWGSNLKLGGTSAASQLDTSKYVSQYVPTVSDDDAKSTASNTGATADNTAAISKSLDITNENLKYIRDIAERSIVNRYTTASITIHQTNNNSIDSKLDLDGVTEHLATAIERQMAELAAEGVHY